MIKNPLSYSRLPSEGELPRCLSCVMRPVGLVQPESRNQALTIRLKSLEPQGK